MQKFVAAAAALSFVVVGCAKPPEKIAASYVSPLLYQNLSCEQLQLEATRVSGRAAELTGAQSNSRGSDAALTAVGIVLFWPALFFIGGDDAQTTELARVKGEMQAIEQASIANNCGLIFSAAPAVPAAGSPAPGAPAAKPNPPVVNKPVGAPR